MISLITPTGARPEAFKLCKQWMIKQTIREPIEWIIVDDCEPQTVGFHIDEAMCFQNRVHLIRPRPYWEPGENTQERNMLAAIERCSGDKIFIIEDDDYYSPQYLELMSIMLDSVELIGECGARYYHIPSRSYKFQRNHFHASLCQTALKRSLLPLLVEACQSGEKFFDIYLWHEARKREVSARLLLGSNLSVGIKGLPGRGGIGVGHTPQGFVSDSDLGVLRGWLSDDWIYYRGFFNA